MHLIKFLFQQLTGTRTSPDCVGFSPHCKIQYEELSRRHIMQTKSFQVCRNLNLRAYYKHTKVVEAPSSSCSQVHEQI